jgi:hypothetical protein
MPSKITLALFACVAYRAASVMALPMQGSSYDLMERDYADFDDLEARMFDNDFEDFVARQTGAPPVAEAPPVEAAVADPNGPPTGANTLAAVGAPGAPGAPGGPHPHHGHRKGARRHRGNRSEQRRRRRERKRLSRQGGAGAKEAAPDASTPVPPQDPNAPAPALTTREPPAEGAPKPAALAEGAAPAPVDGATKPLKAAALADGAPKADTLAETPGAATTPKKAGKGALGPHRRHKHRTVAQLMADPTLSADKRRHLVLKAKRREALRAKRLAALSEGQTVPQQRTKHHLDTATPTEDALAKHAEGAAALANAPVAAPPASAV